MSIYTLVALLLHAIYFGVISARHDIHMFQLNSYRYSRYLRWLGQGNIWSRNRAYAIAIVAFSLIPHPMYAALGTAATIAFALIRSKTGKKEAEKTPLVFTNRVKRLYTTTLLLFAAMVATAAVLSPAYATTTAALLILLSDAVMLGANFVNTPIEKGINRGYYNDAKRIIESNKKHFTLL